MWMSILTLLYVPVKVQNAFQVLALYENFKNPFA